MRWAMLLLLTSGLVVSGCNQGVGLNDLRRRASFDLQCPESQLTHHELGGDIHGVSGCDRRATYIRFCRGWSYGQCVQGEWIINGSGGESLPPQSAGGPPAQPPTWGSPSSAH